MGFISCLRWLFGFFGLMGLKIGYVKGCLVLSMWVKFVEVLWMLVFDCDVILVMFCSVVIIFVFWLIFMSFSSVRFVLVGVKELSKLIVLIKILFFIVVGFL